MFRRSGLRMALLGRGVLAGLAGLLAATGASAQETPVSVGIYPGTMLSVPAFVALDGGFFKKNGLDVSLVPIQNGSAMTAALASGSIKIANNSYDNLSVAVANKLPLKVIVGGTGRLPYAVVARKDLPLPHLAEGYPKVMGDLAHKTLGVIIMGGSAQFIMEQIVVDAGVSAKDVTFIAAGLNTTARPALRNGSIDTYLAFPPLPAILAAKNEGRVVLDLLKNEGPPHLRDLAFNGWIATDRTIQQEPDLVSRFVAANKEAFCWLSSPAHFDEVVGIIKKYVPVPDLDDGQYRAMVKDVLPAFSVNVPRSSLDEWQKIMVEFKQISRPFKAQDLVTAAAPADFACR